MFKEECYPSLNWHYTFRESIQYIECTPNLEPLNSRGQEYTTLEYAYVYFSKALVETISIPKLIYSQSEIDGVVTIVWAPQCSLFMDGYRYEQNISSLIF